MSQDSVPWETLNVDFDKLDEDDRCKVIDGDVVLYGDREIEIGRIALDRVATAGKLLACVCHLAQGRQYLHLIYPFIRVAAHENRIAIDEPF